MIELYISKFLGHLNNIFKTEWGWLVTICTIVVNYFAGHEVSICLILLVCVLDLIWAVVAAIKMGRFCKSILARYTIGKLSVYGTCILIFIALDKITPIDISITVPIISAMIIMVEGWSVMGNLYIVYPHMTFLKIIKHALIGEIANKTGMTKDEVKEMLESDKKRAKAKVKRATA